MTICLIIHVTEAEQNFETVMGVKIGKGSALDTHYNFLEIISAQTSGEHF